MDVAVYKDYLEDLIEEHGKEVVMLGIIGVPVVTERDPEPPYLPLEGGVRDLVFRDPRPGIYPDGDVLSDDPNFDSAEDLAFSFSIGPGCTEVYDDTGGQQAIPAPRIIDVCESLDEVGSHDEKRVRCCIESICDEDLSHAIRCLTGLIDEVVDPIE